MCNKALFGRLQEQVHDMLFPPDPEAIGPVRRSWPKVQGFFGPRDGDPEYALNQARLRAMCDRDLVFRPQGGQLGERPGRRRSVLPSLPPATHLPLSLVPMSLVQVSSQHGVGEKAVHASSSILVRDTGALRCLADPGAIALGEEVTALLTDYAGLRGKSAPKVSYLAMQRTESEAAADGDTSTENTSAETSRESTAVPTPRKLVDVTVGTQHDLGNAVTTDKKSVAHLQQLKRDNHMLQVREEEQVRDGHCQVFLAKFGKSSAWKQFKKNKLRPEWKLLTGLRTFPAGSSLLDMVSDIERVLAVYLQEPPAAGGAGIT
mmetsp:Transcript_17850/g.38852  ORF Transcript_17850/g.38852 Transcript_17850/m.38852 type:complete len:319 (-) Transcript_17850:1253-2209(-)